jgi:hypothetical protein
VGTLILIGLVAGVVYLAACAWWPFIACHRCDGTGKRRSPSGKAWRPCRRCDGSGKAVRLGRQVYETLRGYGD